jgi:hypothetical protein
MRHIHPVGIQEKFVASGRYHHPYVIHWTIHEMPDGAWMIRLDQDGRETDGTSLLVEAWRSPIAEGGKIARFDIWGYGGKMHRIQQVKARYFIADNTLEAGIQFGNSPQTTQSIPFPKNAILIPDIPLFWGFAIPPIMAQGGKGTIFSCLINFDIPEAFSATITEKEILSFGDDEIHIGDKRTPAKKFLMDANHFVWIDDLGVVLAYINTNSTTEVIKNYARRPKR